MAQTIGQLKRLGLIDAAALKQLEDHASRCLDEAVQHCTQTNTAGIPCVREDLWAKPETFTVGLRDETVCGQAPFVEQADVACTREIKFSDAIAEVIGRWLEREPLAFVLGEEVANMGGGAYGATVAQSLDAAQQLAAEGLEVEVIDLRTLDSAGLDYATIGESLHKTGMLVTVEQAPATNSIGAKIAAECVRRFFDAFDGAPLAVAAPDIPLAVSRRAERACLPATARIVDAMRQSARREV